MSYDPIPSEDGSEKELSRAEMEALKSDQRKKFFSKYTRSLTGVSIIVAIALFVALLLPEAKHLPRAPEECGNSTSEALSLGCSFDVMSFAWLPARCFDKELMEQFLAIRDWQWYLDSAGTKIADYTAVTAGQHEELYVTQEYQMYHCTYMWRKMHRAVLAGGVLDGYIGDIHHTAHCEMQMLQQGRQFNETSTTIYSKYVNCPIAQEDAGRWGWYRMINGHRVHRNP